MDRRLLQVLLAVLFGGTSVFGQSLDGLSLRDSVGERSVPAAPRIAQQIAIEPAVTLDSIFRAMPEKVAEIEAWNESGRLPYRNGVARPLIDPVRVDIAGTYAAAKDGAVPLGRGVLAPTARGMTWAGNVKVAGAMRLRLHLRDVKLPDGATLWVYGGSDTTPFGKELIDPTGGLWTPSTWGETAHFEVEVPAGATASFAIDEVLELLDDGGTTSRRLEPRANDTPSCLQDVTCVSLTPLPLSDVRRAIAHLEYVSGGSGFVCSGGLINNIKSDGTPYLLTANHCISTQTEASSLQSFFDWSFANCASTTIPPLSSVPKVSGATLMATKDLATGSDVTLLRLTTLPANRYLLGWTTDRNTFPGGTRIYRISHPAPVDFGPLPQEYSTTLVSATGSHCGLDTTNFIFSTNDSGGVYGGSSGSPVLIANGQIVGQLFGACAPAGHDPKAGCDTANLTVDGAFAASYAVVQPYVNPSTTAGCTPSATVVCLNSNRFSVRIDWKTSGGQTGQGQAIKYTDASALFWFFGSDNIEVLLKILNACSLSNTYWVFAAATTDVEYTIYVTDTLRGNTKTYFHAGGTPAPAITDTGAFATCP